MKQLLVFALLGLVQGRVSFDSPGSLTSRIVGGIDATPHSAPYSAMLIAPSGQAYCGGSVITPSAILTAAHCFDNSQTAVKVRAGGHVRTPPEAWVQERYVSNITKHASFQGGVGPYDIAIVFVNESFSINANVSVIDRVVTDVSSGDADLFGWGLKNSSPATLPAVLQTARMSVLNYSTCESDFGGPNASPLSSFSNICANSAFVSACNGDSGGPLVRTNPGDDTVLLLGIVSWGVTPCGEEGYPSVFTKVSAFETWITDRLP